MYIWPEHFDKNLEGSYETFKNMIHLAICQLWHEKHILNKEIISSYPRLELFYI